MEPRTLVPLDLRLPIPMVFEPMPVDKTWRNGVAVESAEALEFAYRCGVGYPAYKPCPSMQLNFPD